MGHRALALGGLGSDFSDWQRRHAQRCAALPTEVRSGRILSLALRTHLGQAGPTLATKFHSGGIVKLTVCTLHKFPPTKSVDTICLYGVYPCDTHLQRPLS